MFSQNLTLQEAFETAAQMHEELIRTEFDGAFCQKSWLFPCEPVHQDRTEKAMLEHTIRLHTRETIYLNLSPITCTILRFIASHGIY